MISIPWTSSSFGLDMAYEGNGLECLQSSMTHHHFASPFFTFSFGLIHPKETENVKVKLKIKI